MHKSLLTVRTITSLVGIGLLAGCTQTRNWIDRSAADNDRDVQPVILGAPTADDYLLDLERLAIGDPATQVEIFTDAESRATLTPNPSTTLKFALVLATPGHAESDPQRAQSLLRELLAQSPLMTSIEIALAQVYLAAVEDRIVLESEARRLRRSNARQQQTEERALNQRLAAVEAENRKLRGELADAEEKLDAITSIERSLREQEQ